MGQMFIESLNGVDTEVEYLTPEELIAQLETDEFHLIHGENSIIGRIQDYHASNEGIDEKDAVIQCLDKAIISEYEYDLVYHMIMVNGLYSQFN